MSDINRLVMENLSDGYYQKYYGMKLKDIPVLPRGATPSKFYPHPGQSEAVNAAARAAAAKTSNVLDSNAGHLSREYMSHMAKSNSNVLLQKISGGINKYHQLKG